MSETNLQSGPGDESANKTAGTPRACWLRTKGLWLLGVAAICFLLVPNAPEGHMAGIWYVIGWPLPTANLRVGPMQFGGPVGLHPDIDLYGMMNVAVWVVVFLSVYCMGRSGRESGIAVAIVRILILIAVTGGAVWVGYGVYSVIECLTKKG